MPVGTLDQAGITLLAALFCTADGRHQKALVVGFVLQLQSTVQVIGGPQMLAPPLVDLLHQVPSDGLGFGFAVGLLEPDKGGIGVAINHRIALGLNQLAGAAHDLVAAHRN
ncbi:hypothetical protein D3C78_524670 [compost metagenome]